MKTIETLTIETLQPKVEGTIGEVIWTSYVTCIQTAGDIGNGFISDEVLASIRRGVADVDAGRVYSWDEVRSGCRMGRCITSIL